MCAPCVPPTRTMTIMMHRVHRYDAGERVIRGKMSRSQREGQLDDDADYQTAYQSARKVAVSSGRG